MNYRILILSAASAAVVACGDHAAPTAAARIPAPLQPAQPALSLLRGTVQVNANDGTIWLQQDTARTQLFGGENIGLNNVDGAEVEVRGTFDAGAGMAVANFLVLIVHGRPAWDGVLVETDGAYALRMPDGSLRAIADPPAELLMNLGARIWVTPGDDALPLAFGFIAVM